ncbi:hypothetical protein B0T26DRAFT_650815 [Lasiosphaeria miniovina]|uniref:Uncharacterized protein n=1 Tax=Lasiosphaeria miniovina TaxID=1954250 RepID=A0AA40ABL2_9PEZI|nr:uncharacterized protein B0T26DRAFT_650815 [Lasiosphaeria miniovina]KAK0712856.1 hypothetical protein B0T26DRAFT_650815 [Lasiosphaeria miniovina]
MELARVDALVDGLAEAFEAGLDFYMRWKKRVDSQNHYRRPEKASPAATSKCAVSTSLDMSSHRIRATYQVGFALIGPEFSAGDGSSSVFPARDEFDRQTAVWSTTSDMPVFQSEPPSPPLTPKVPTDDTESCFGLPSEVGHATGRQALRPKNSVFSIFCPEAMALQVDPNRPIPASSKGKCSCGYRWKVPELSEATNYMPLKDGFRVTRRFLAKSHCDQSPDEGVAIGSSTEQPSPGYGCVLCTSTGRTETFETAENLQTHINATHDKWQMLHDKDMISPAVNGLAR